VAAIKARPMVFLSIYEDSVEVFEELIFVPTAMRPCGASTIPDGCCQMPSPAVRPDGGVSLGQYGGIAWQIVSSAAASQPA